MLLSSGKSLLSPTEAPDRPGLALIPETYPSLTA